MGNICFCSQLDQPIISNFQQTFCKKKTSYVFKSASCYTSQSYILFEKLLKSSTPFVSIFGTYKVSLKNHNGSITLNQLANYFVSLVNSNQEFNENDRMLGHSISKLIYDFKDKCLLLYKKKCFLVKLISKIIGVFQIFCATGQFWCDRNDLRFNTYTSKQFVIKTGIEPKIFYGNSWRNYIHGSGSFENPRVWDLKENKRNLTNENT